MAYTPPPMVEVTVELEPRIVELVDSLAHMRAKERGPIIRDMVLDYLLRYRQGYDKVVQEVQAGES